MPKINAKVSIGCPTPREGWSSFQFNVKAFKDLATTKNYYVETPEFSCNGHDWMLCIYPGGEEDADEGNVSIFLNHRSKGSISVTYGLMILDKFGNEQEEFQMTTRFEGINKGYGCPDFILRSDILDESNQFLGSDGTLTVAVSMEDEPTTIFIPKNQFQKIVLQDMFLNEDTADVCFEVCNAEAKEEEKKETTASAFFHAHSLILKTGAPMLANLFDLDSSEKIVSATITGVKPAIFRHLLWYVYGGSVLEEDLAIEEHLATHVKEIIDAADKYSIVNLKLEAEAVYVESTDITMDNVMDDLLYADAMNCALLKEAVMNFLAENGTDAAEKLSFNDVPGYLMKDLLLTVGKNSRKEEAGTTADELSTLCVSALRRKLAEKGLDVDGSREAMIESIRNNS